MNRDFKDVYKQDYSDSFKIPYRINWCGSYTDCLGKPAITSTIDKYMYFIFAPSNNTDIIRVYSDEFEDIFEQRLEPINFRYGTWVDYVTAALQSLTEVYNLDRGVTIYVQADLPSGLGLGSSAMFVTGIIRAIAEVNELPLTDNELVEFAYKAEHEFLNIPCGLMDFKAIQHTDGTWVIDNAASKLGFDLPITNKQFDVMIAYDKHSQHKHLNNKDFDNAAALDGDAASRYLEYERTFVNEMTKIMNMKYDDDIQLALLGVYMLLCNKNLNEFLDSGTPYYFNNVQGVYGYKALGSGLKGSLFLLVNPDHQNYIIETLNFYGLNVVLTKTL